MLLDAGYQVDFIGSRSTGLHEDAVWPDRNGVAFDPDHEGHYGWKTGEIRDKLAEWVAEYPAAPDIALIHLGSNDYGAINYYGAIVRPLTDIIRTLRSVNPNVVILVGHLNEQGATPWVIRQLVEGTAYWMNTEESPVVTVAHFEGWVEDPDDPGAHTFDHAHPNPRGQAKMAQAWFETLTPHLDRIRQRQVSSR
jgi:lysophospholipase L1-like esterase